MQREDGILRGRLEAGIVVAIWLLSGALGLLVGGCTSEPTGPLGSELVENPISGVLDTLTIYDLVSYSALGIEDSGPPLWDQELVYLGHQVTDGDSTSSAILINYDFGDVYDETYTPDVLTSSNIEKVELQMLLPTYYYTGIFAETPDKILPKYYEVRQLDEPFVEEDYPGPLPPSRDLDIWLLPSLHESGNTVLLPIHPENLLTWLAAGDTVGLLIQEWENFSPSAPGLVGHSSRDMKHAMSQIGNYSADTSVGPTIEVTLTDPAVTLFIKPIADTSTFHKVAPAPADPAEGLMMRTCLRNYPVLRFDMSQLPANVFINRATLTVVNDTTTSFGNLESIVVSEFTDSGYQTPIDTLSISGLQSRVHQISGMTSLDPLHNSSMTFNVTAAIQRLVNDVYEGDRSLVLSAGEDFFPSYDLTTVDPDFFFVRFNFYGTAADETLRPRLKITYSLIDDFQEVGP